jgi:DnaK suppressor protein
MTDGATPGSDADGPHPSDEAATSPDQAAPDDPVAALLAAKRAELESELATLSAPASDLGGIGFGKRVGEGTSLAVERLSQVAAHDGLGAMLADVVRAQAKLADGGYGSCDDCGQPIAPDRLAALPWATRCIACQSRR